MTDEQIRLRCLELAINDVDPEVTAKKYYEFVKGPVVVSGDDYAASRMKYKGLKDYIGVRSR